MLVLNCDESQANKRVNTETEEKKNIGEKKI